jgi:hypothetical protein
MEVNDEGGASLPYTHLNLTHVEVDVEGLDDFRKLVGRELDSNLRPAAAGIQSDHALGVAFGLHNPSQMIRSAQLQYGQVLGDSTRTLAIYINAAERLIEAITRISANYRDADLTSSAMTDVVRKELLAVTAQALDPLQYDPAWQQAEMMRRDRERQPSEQAGQA